MTDTDEHMPIEWENLAEVGRYQNLAQAQEHGLVILAMREPCWVSPDPASGGYSLHAEPTAATRIAHELLEYDEEQGTPAPSPAAGSEMFRFSAGWGVYAIWMSILILTFVWQVRDPSITDIGASSSRDLIGNGQWWRPFTALFLHGDAPHLIGNLISGLFFGSLVARSIGALRGWALILASGVAGNALTSAITWPESFVSIGASTAVFGALGILSGLGFHTMLRSRVRLPWAKITAPLVAGVILLGWMGGGAPGGNTDVLGHVFGFASGLTAGLVVGQLTPATADASTAETATAAHGEPT